MEVALAITKARMDKISAKKNALQINLRWDNSMRRIFSSIARCYIEWYCAIGK
jgi:ribosomal protein L17